MGLKGLCLLGFCCLTPGLAWAAVPAEAEETAFLAATVAASRLEPLYHPDFSLQTEALASLYPAATPSLLWLDAAGKPLPVARQLLTALSEAEARGLRGRDYDLAWLEDAVAKAETAALPPGPERARLDFTLSLGLLRYVSDLHIGRVDPRKVGFKIDVEPRHSALLAEAGAALAAGDVAGLIARAEPSSPLYERLIRALARYRVLAREVQEPALVFATKVSPGDPLPEALALFRYLAAIGDAEGLVEPVADPLVESTLAGDVLVALRRFQERHGLKPDGIIGAGTAAALAAPLEYRVRQIELTLERLRWLPDLGGGPLVAVNIPEFRLWVFNGGEEPVMNMAVVVGKGLNTQTPVFLKQMRSIVFSPYWNVPYSITRKEYVPKLAMDPGYLARHDYELVGPGAEGGVTTENLRALRSGVLRMRQRPGKQNALGGIKFDFPNEESVYLHSTPQKGLFARERRALSHGCVRVEEPIKLAQFVLADQADWTAERIEKEMQRGRPFTLKLSRSVPVLLFYATAVVGTDGRAAFFEDLYGHDRRLDQALAH